MMILKATSFFDRHLINTQYTNKITPNILLSFICPVTAKNKSSQS